MKKIVFACIALLGAHSLIAQCPEALEGPAKGGDVLAASTIVREGGDPIEAVQFIERGITHPKKKLLLATWERRGDVYVNMHQKIPGVCPEALVRAKDSFLKAKELDVKNRRTEYLNNALVNVGSLSFNSALDAYTNKDYTEAASYFSMTSDAYESAEQTTDSVYMIAVFNTGLANHNGGNMDLAAEYYQKSIDINYDVKQCYYRMIYMYNNAEMTDKALEAIQKGKAQFPDEPEFLIQETNIHLKNKDYEKAESALRGAVKNDPSNAMLHFVLGTALEQLDKPEDAIQAYKDAIEVDENYSDAYHNLGAAYYNQYVAYTNEAGDLDFRSQSAKITELENKAEKSLESAMPFLEKAHSMDPTNVPVMNSLKSIYFTFSMTEKYDAMVAKIKALEG